MKNFAAKHVLNVKNIMLVCKDEESRMLEALISIISEVNLLHKKYFCLILDSCSRYKIQINIYKKACQMGCYFALGKSWF